ncbi:hypothetical protein [Methylocapsa acidiphila]|uniref:hypothetical protein n=1 Tax=Methylocapsa acidiphila TaxID=133552 RepID=UPI000400B5F1|nr:hypothetical protein [Methylocapsa acidiphila]
MERMSISAALLVAAIALSGCNQTSGPAPSAPSAVATAPDAAASGPGWPNLPAGAACTGELNRYQAVLKADVSTGNVNKSVYDKIQGELSRAAEACAAGRDGEAQSLIRASKERHGYRA